MIAVRRSDISRGFTLVEMLTTVAVLVIVFGLMVSLARDVRKRSAAGLTAETLSKLDVLLDQYLSRYGALPPVPAILPAGGGVVDEAIVRGAARQNNQRFIHAFRGMGSLERPLGDLPASLYNEASLLDGWGTPIVLMEKMNNSVGMAPGDRPFFFSAGPDRRYLTREDNLYSYDRSVSDAKSLP